LAVVAIGPKGPTSPFLKQHHGKTTRPAAKEAFNGPRVGKVNREPE
jgi:hypothetical protein